MSDTDKNYEDFLKSLQEDNTNTQEGFPFSEDFDIENFIKATEAPAATNQNNQNQTPKAPVQQTTSAPINNKENTFQLLDTPTLKEEPQVNFDTNSNSIKRLEEKLSDLQQRFNEANTAKEEESAFAAELNKQEDDLPQETVKGDEEFFTNISSAIQTLKGSLDNIVNTRLRYEENLIKQDQTLITRLKEKTSRLKAINLALNSEVKRAKNEKLEYLRKTAEQTKELLSLRMQLSHAEERSKQADFKVSDLEQQITLLTQEKTLLDEEIAKIRQEKLNYLQNSAEQTRNIMDLRHQLAAKEEALKQEEIKSNFLDQQLKTVEAAHLALKQQQMQDNDTQRTLQIQKQEIESLTNQLNESRMELAKKSEEITLLRQQLLNLQFSPEQNKNEAAAFAVKQEELLAPLKMSQEDHERKIALLRAEQSAELQKLRTKALQEETALRGELQRAEAKYQQEATFVNTLKAQIKTLEDNLKGLESEKENYKTKSETVAKEIEAIKQNNQAELENLRENLRKAQNSYDKQQDFYNTLETQYQNTQREKYYLGEELKKVIMQKDNALLQNERYLSEIEKLKNEQNDLTQNLKKEIQDLLASRNQISQELNALKQAPNQENTQIALVQNNLQENNVALELLKTQMAALLNSRSDTDKALLEAREEKLQLLNKLDAQTKQLNTLQNSYQAEIAALTQENNEARAEAENKIKSLEEKIKLSEGLILSLTQQIRASKENIVNQEGEDLQAERAKNQKLTQELEKAQKVFSQDTILLEELKNQYSKLQERNNILETELGKAITESKQIALERDNYKNQVEELNSQLNNVKAELQKGQEFTQQLSEQVNKLKMVNVALNAAVKQAQNQKIEALNATAKQTQEILELKEQLRLAQTDQRFLEFNQGVIKLKSEYELKIKNLEEELKKVSAVCVAQTKEINEIKTDNTRLKTVAEEKLLLQNRFNALQKNASLLTEELKVYKEKGQANTLVKAKAAALTAQLERVNKEKDNLKQQLEKAQIELKAAAERERKTNSELETLRKTLAQNEENIAKLKAQIAPLMQQKPASNNVQQPKAEDIKPKFTAPQKEDDELEDTLSDTFDDTVNSVSRSKQDRTVVELKNTVSSPAQRDILADYDEDEKDDASKTNSDISFLENSKLVNDVEEVNLPTKSMDLSKIFDEEEDTLSARDLTAQDQKVVVEEVKPTDITELMNKQKEQKQKVLKELKDTVSENTFTDHSIRRSVVNRHPYARNPLTTFQKNEEYSDFLKKTKSMFYRIKWSLFKD